MGVNVAGSLAAMTKPTKLTLGIGVAAFGCAAAALASSRDGASLAAALWAWTALACAIVAVAYARNLPQVFGKRAGRIALPNLVLLFPYLGAFWVACALMRTFRRRADPWNEVATDIYVGGRTRGSALPRGFESGLVVDLTSEFSEPAALRSLPGYRGFPVLDGHFPADEEAFAALMREVAAAPGWVLFHCESGRGRAPTAAAIALIARGIVPDAESALELVAKGRPQSAPTRSDLAFITRLTPKLLS